MFVCVLVLSFCLHCVVNKKVIGTDDSLQGIGEGNPVLIANRRIMPMGVLVEVRVPTVRSTARHTRVDGQLGTLRGRKVRQAMLALQEQGLAEAMAVAAAIWVVVVEEVASAVVPGGVLLR